MSHATIFAGRGCAVVSRRASRGAHTPTASVTPINTAPNAVPHMSFPSSLHLRAGTDTPLNSLLPCRATLMPATTRRGEDQGRSHLGADWNDKPRHALAALRQELHDAHGDHNTPNRAQDQLQPFRREIWADGKQGDERPRRLREPL